MSERGTTQSLSSTKSYPTRDETRFASYLLDEGQRILAEAGDDPALRSGAVAKVIELERTILKLLPGA